jgi:hypothetical protein
LYCGGHVGRFIGQLLPEALQAEDDIHTGWGMPESDVTAATTRKHCGTMFVGQPHDGSNLRLVGRAGHYSREHAINSVRCCGIPGMTRLMADEGLQSGGEVSVHETCPSGSLDMPGGGLRRGCL